MSVLTHGSKVAVAAMAPTVLAPANSLRRETGFEVWVIVLLLICRCIGVKVGVKVGVKFDVKVSLKLAGFLNTQKINFITLVNVPFAVSLDKRG